MYKFGETVKVDKSKRGVITKEGAIYYTVAFSDGRIERVMINRIEKL